MDLTKLIANFKQYGIISLWSLGILGVPTVGGNVIKTAYDNYQVNQYSTYTNYYKITNLNFEEFSTLKSINALPHQKN